MEGWGDIANSVKVSGNDCDEWYEYSLSEDARQNGLFCDLTAVNFPSMGRAKISKYGVMCDSQMNSPVFAAFPSTGAVMMVSYASRLIVLLRLLKKKEL